MEAQPAKLRFIDSHAHLHLAAERLKLASFGELEAAMAKHVASQPRFQLEAIVNVYCETDELAPGHASHEVLRAANVFGAFGNHPHNASKWSDAVEAGLREVLKHEKCVAVGECGLDYHYMMSPKEDQLRVFRRHCEIAVELGLPLVVHSREAEEDTIAILTELVSEKRDWFSVAQTRSDAARLADSLPLLHVVAQYGGAVARVVPESVHWLHWSGDLQEQCRRARGTHCCSAGPIAAGNRRAVHGSGSASGKAVPLGARAAHGCGAVSSQGRDRRGGLCRSLRQRATHVSSSCVSKTLRAVKRFTATRWLPWTR
jgi:Tat protein secretion system quality control protein TatD with DNase activity